MSVLGLSRDGPRELLRWTLIAALPAAATAWAAGPWALWWAAVPVGVAWFFRDPERTPPPGPGLLLAPADGLLDDLREEAACPFFPGPALRLGIFLSLLDVHVQRAPCRARVRSVAARRGARRATYAVGQTDQNEQCVTVFERLEPPAAALAVRQLAGPAARRIRVFVAAGGEVAAGDRFGLIKLGSRCELWLPRLPGLMVLARLGQRVRAGETVLAAFG